MTHGVSNEATNKLKENYTALTKILKELQHNKLTYTQNTACLTIGTRQQLNFITSSQITTGLEITISMM
jgi:hypothetical protein